jgi:hypothetical protein
MMNADDPQKLPGDEPENTVESQPVSDLKTEPESESESDLKIEPESEPESEPELEAESENEDEVIEIAPPAESTPVSAAPPRIVAETPIGGKVRPAPAPREPAPKIESVEPLPDVVEAEPEAPAVESPLSEAEAPTEVPPHEPPHESAKEPAIPSPAQPAAPSVMSTSEVDAAKADDWDEDISPELAALLFRPKKSEAPARAAVTETPAGEVIPAAAETAPAARTIPTAKPIHLTHIDEARSLPITAQGVSSPPPNVQPQGKARYQRVEEPLPNGQRTEERWEFRGPDYPMIGDRIVKGVASRETVYTDGSWHWMYERVYADGGVDSREIRANTDHTYLERSDAVRSKDPATGKHVKRKENEAMILAGPPREEKRGFLSSLLGRGKNDDDGPKEWRVASPHEAGHARKEGGMAFARKVLGLF